MTKNEYEGVGNVFYSCYKFAFLNIILLILAGLGLSISVQCLNVADNVTAIVGLVLMGVTLITGVECERLICKHCFGKKETGNDEESE